MTEWSHSDRLLIWLGWKIQHFGRQEVVQNKRKGRVMKEKKKTPPTKKTNKKEKQTQNNNKKKPPSYLTFQNA